MDIWMLVVVYILIFFFFVNFFIKLIFFVKWMVGKVLKKFFCVWVLEN